MKKTLRALVELNQAVWAASTTPLPDSQLIKCGVCLLSEPVLELPETILAPNEPAPALPSLFS
jgi:hypothetical protein